MNEKPAKKRQLVIGDQVIKTGTDFRFQGEIVSVFRNRKGSIRYAVENPDGICLIFTPAQLVTVDQYVPSSAGHGPGEEKHE